MNQTEKHIRNMMIKMKAKRLEAVTTLGEGLMTLHPMDIQILRAKIEIYDVSLEMAQDLLADFKENGPPSGS